MLRAIAAVIVAYIVMAVIIMAALFGALFILGERLLEPGAYRATTVYTFYVLVVSLLAAVIGGWVCRKIGRSTRPVTVLAAIVFGMGVIGALMNLGKEDAGPRPADEKLVAAVSKARQPDWYAWTLPIVAAIGIMAGGGRKNYVSPEHIPAPRV